MGANQAPSPTNTIIDRQRRVQLLRQFWSQYAIYIILLIVLVAAAYLSPVFLRPRNITNLLRQASILGIVSIGQTFVILTGGIDLSVASVMALMSVLAANLMDGNDGNVYPVIVLCLGVASLIGLFNGLLVTRINIPPFIATLGTILIIQGARFVYTGGAPKGSIPDGLRFWGRGTVTNVPTAIIVCLVVIIVTTVLLSRTTFGRRLYAVGGNAKTAYLSGTDVKRTVVSSYVICSFLAGVAGLMLTGYIGLADNWLGRGFELDSIAAAVVGGALLDGGKGNALGTMAGVLIIIVLFNLVVLLNLDEEYQRIIKGVVIIAAVALYTNLRGGDR